ncbi:helix-turn-helix domain-containing protein [Methylorubrum thiocyanatum]|uniref:helix-turn-helix domain-containing protein n=1 Tax=Methylorubrum thiocyanatum TaxID=47958 RepID=UPI00383AABB1
MFADHLRSAIEAAPRITLPTITAQLWRAFGEGHVTEAEAEALSALIEARQVLRSPDPGATTGSTSPDAPQDRVRSPRTGRNGSRPRTDASMERRRRWAASGRMPPAIAARFTLAEQSVLSLVAAETCRRKDCRLSVGGMAAIAGVSETTVRNAIREAVRLGLLTVEERRITGWRNDTNVLRIVSAEWLSWLRLTRKRREEAPSWVSEGGGCKSAKGTPTEVLSLCKSRPADPLQGLPSGSGRPHRQRANRNREAR